VTFEYLSDFDASRVGRRQRRSAVRQIRRATMITEADRQLRVQRARAAQTRGELNALTRDLDGGGAASLPAVGHDIGPVTSAASPVAPPAPAPSPLRPSSPPGRGTRSRSARPSVTGRIVVAVLIAAVTFGGAAVSGVSSIVSGFDEQTVEVPADELTSVVEWSQMLDAFGQEVDTTRVVSLDVDGRTAVLAAPDPDDPEALLRFYYDGDVTSTSPAPRLSTDHSFDLTAVATTAAESAVLLARARSGADEVSWPSVRIDDHGPGPQITVTFTDGTVGGYELVVDPDGTMVSETS
jgi:hypothetical protein